MASGSFEWKTATCKGHRNIAEDMWLDLWHWFEGCFWSVMAYMVRYSKTDGKVDFGNLRVEDHFFEALIVSFCPLFDAIFESYFVRIVLFPRDISDKAATARLYPM